MSKKKMLLAEYFRFSGEKFAQAKTKSQEKANRNSLEKAEKEQKIKQKSMTFN